MVKRVILGILSLLLLAGVIQLGVRNASDNLAEHLSLIPLAHAGEDNRVPILMYHKVNPNPTTGGLGLRVTPGSFERQMRYLDKNGFQTISLEHVMSHYTERKPLPPRPIVITFDDGYEDNYRYAFPILKRYNMIATIFVVADTIGGINEFDYKSGHQPMNKMATWDQLKEMAAYGISIESHTVTHPHMAEVSLEQARQELVESKEILEKGLGRPVNYFCYPYGSYNQDVAKLVEESGYKAAVTTVQGLATPDSDPYTLKRIRVLGHYSQREFLNELLKHRKDNVRPYAIVNND